MNPDRRIRFVSCSATISKPKEHMKAIFGLEVCANTAYVHHLDIQFWQDVEAITQDGAPSGKKEFLLWRCPGSSGATPISEATRVMSYLMKRGVRVILFCKVNSYCASYFLSRLTSF
jgi:DEAD/DEAH box helicase domain-containing protein